MFPKAKVPLKGKNVVGYKVPNTTYGSLVKFHFHTKPTQEHKTNLYEMVEDRVDRALLSPDYPNDSAVFEMSNVYHNGYVQVSCEADYDFFEFPTPA